MYRTCAIVLFLLFSFKGDAHFISTHKELKKHYKNSKAILVASTGRSGSSMLFSALKKASSKRPVFKTHLLPPGNKFKGKIIFIYSNPDQAVESVLHKCLSVKNFWRMHAAHMETSDRSWFRKIPTVHHQTAESNLLSYDAFGCARHLQEWLHSRTKPCPFKDANILAIKYENLWDPTTIHAIKAFLNLKSFSLPPYRPRGFSEKQLLPQERHFREIYNLGTDEMPVYKAYDHARALWEKSPPYQFFKIKG